jgi:hypothetical protein
MNQQPTPRVSIPARMPQADAPTVPTEPFFWLAISLFLVGVSLTAVLVVAIPAAKELTKAARSAEKLFDVLQQELPPTLESLRSTGEELSELTSEVRQGVSSAGNVVQQVDVTIADAKERATQVQTTTKGIFIGVRAAWKAFRQPPKG